MLKLAWFIEVSDDSLTWTLGDWTHSLDRVPGTGSYKWTSQYQNDPHKDLGIVPPGVYVTIRDLIQKADKESK